ncbi:MAG: DUF192 domain-containing protein [Chloroflexi bacterium]|uniref:DUF192 domain-containing protein n=1 Tax=Candidatus Chlorohelix allophototropha TaxID=3003348 RepID=A0A8T7M0K2_9CHLR|nr:DUF192 domain-containing protein [Chloroflexota bacterium]WJW66803.1 DUF192 domain-containing protein [Chloroflexota bacterium L227-S17]
MSKPKVLILFLFIAWNLLLSGCDDSIQNVSQPTNTSLKITTTSFSATIPAPTPTTSIATPGQSQLTASAAVIRKTNGEEIKMTVELARTPREQETGLMGRQSLPADSGMLFIFPETGKYSFWMKDTPLALSIAFIASDGKLVDIRDMNPFSEEIITPKAEHLYALEVTQGYFAQKGIKVGDIFKLG